MSDPTAIFKTVLLVDDGETYLQAFKRLIQRPGVVEVVHYALSGREALEKIKKFRPQLVILDVDMKGMNGYECLCQITRRYPEIKVLANSMYEDAGTVAKMINAGSSGYLSKNCELDELKQAFTYARDDRYYFSKLIRENLTPDLIKKYNLPFTGNNINLTQRQLDVMALMVDGEDTNTIAKKLFISPNTVAHHRKIIYKETKTHSLQELLKFNSLKNLVSKWWGK